MAVGTAGAPVQQPSFTCPLQLSSTAVVHDSETPGFTDAEASLQSVEPDT